MEEDKYFKAGRLMNRETVFENAQLVKSAGLNPLIAYQNAGVVPPKLVAEDYEFQRFPNRRICTADSKERYSYGLIKDAHLQSITETGVALPYKIYEIFKKVTASYQFVTFGNLLGVVVNGSGFKVLGRVDWSYSTGQSFAVFSGKKLVPLFTYTDSFISHFDLTKRKVGGGFPARRKTKKYKLLVDKIGHEHRVTFDLSPFAVTIKQGGWQATVFTSLELTS